MLTKILFTAVVIGLVVAVYRIRGTRGTPRAQGHDEYNPAGIWMAYGFVALLVAASSVWYFLHWRAEHRIVTIRVFQDGSSTPTVYRAHRNAIQGRVFETLDGRRVRLGDGDRVEMSEREP